MRKKNCGYGVNAPHDSFLMPSLLQSGAAEGFLHHQRGQRPAMRARARLGAALAQRDHHDHFEIRRHAETGGGLGEIETDHGAGVVTHVHGRQHQHGGMDRSGAQQFVMLQVGAALIETPDHRQQLVSHGGGDVAINFRGVVMGIALADDVNDRRAVGDLRLVPCQLAQLLFAGGVAHHDKAGALQVEGGRAQIDQAEEPLQFDVGDFVVGIEGLAGKAFADGFGEFHGLPFRGRKTALCRADFGKSNGRGAVSGQGIRRLTAAGCEYIITSCRRHSPPA